MILGRFHRRPDRGESLIELLMTLMILGIGSIAIIGALSTTVISTEGHRRLSNTEVVGRDYAELIKSKLLDAPATTLTADVAAHDAGDSITLAVASTTGFPATGFSVAIDGEIFTVSSKTATTLVTTALASSTHDAGARVVRHYSCPTDTDLETAAFSVPDRIAAPDVTLVEYYNAQGVPIPAANCASYWQNNGTCSVVLQHRTECDPALIRATVVVRSTDTGARSAYTTTHVLIRRMA